MFGQCCHYFFVTVQLWPNSAAVNRVVIPAAPFMWPGAGALEKKVGCGVKESPNYLYQIRPSYPISR